jgi:hypothetical protein
LGTLPAEDVAAGEHVIAICSGSDSVALDPVPVEYKHKGRGAMGVLGGMAGSVASGATGLLPMPVALAPAAGSVAAGAVGALTERPHKYEYFGHLRGTAAGARVARADSIHFLFHGTKDMAMQLQLGRFTIKGNTRRVSLDRFSTMDYVDPAARIEVVLLKTADDVWRLAPSTALPPGQYGVFLNRLGPVADFEVVAAKPPEN